ncbi:TRAP transporter substrate-binding protein [Psychromonas arctica]|uniref:TRAP transporter substrate-binding protein n=1 Tax=Psychromonas arctica TaxID=168275 RepID=UPI00041E792B|nr:TRAP transporter substrate-binding protein [Psychromonas arctica]
MMKTNFLKFMIALCFSLVISKAATAAQVLHVATWLPPSHTMNVDFWPTWGKWVEEATEGRVTVKVEYGMGHPKSIYDLVEDGVAEAGFSYHGYVPGRFKLPQAVELPGLGVKAEAASVALWRVQQKYFAKAHEFEGLALIGMFTHGPGYVHTIDPITSLAQLKGKKIRIGGGIQSELGERLGITPIAAPASKVYEMLQQGVIDGVFLPINEQKALRLAEVAPNVLKVPGGMYLGSFSIFMNEDFLANLSQKDRDAIMSVSGEKLSALAGRLYDEDDVKGEQYAKEMGGNIVEAEKGGKLSQEFQKISEGLEAEWVESVKDTGVQGQQALDELKEIAQNYGN